jgi:hypothetical protein
VSARSRLLVLLAALAWPASADVDAARVPPELKESFEVFKVRCSKCHALSKPYNVRLSADGWTRYVAKMKRRPGSGINDENGAKIVSFLTWKDKEPVEAPPPADGGTP